MTGVVLPRGAPPGLDFELARSAGWEWKKSNRSMDVPYGNTEGRNMLLIN